MGQKIRLNGRIRELIGEMLEMPSAPVSGGFSVSVTDGREATVVGCLAILSYDDSAITVGTGSGRLTLSGEGLDIVNYTDREITVKGRIKSVITEDR